ncbi:MAG: cytochrome c [Crocinitomicaceae bacterium]|jgi:mono/diheme cytochrome c family protein|nr:cytochrome c [Crocinitomicaceae bacterium]MBT5403093.1 cytochrome c [Crocinitomicaceae bacterium]MBT6513780.1 cytochrome c [Crocinitomicaceae bacterium]
MADLAGSNFIKTTIVTLSLLAGACNNEKNSISTEVGPTTLEEVNVLKLYIRHCVDCHGENGDLGLMGAKSLVTSAMPISERIELITHGSKNGKMKPFGVEHYGDLNTIEIEALAKYIETLRH